MSFPKKLLKMKWKPSFFIPFFIFIHLLFYTANSYAYQENDDEFVVVLDAGHGGHDPGNLGNGYLEKNIALNIVLRVGSILKQNSNIKVIYTRDDDTFVDLYVRGEIANKANADLFVSVHCDSHTSDAYGAGTFVLGLHANKQNFEIAKKENSVIYLEDNYETRYADYDINSPESVIGLTIMQEEFLDQSIALAKNIQENFAGKLKRKDREVKQAGFIVLHQTFMPSVLIETGFLTNKSEGAYLNSSKGQSEMGAAIADAILRYRSGIRSNATRLIASNTPEPTPRTESESTIKTVENDQKEAEALAAEKAKADQAERDRIAIEEKKKELEALAQKRKDEEAARKAKEAELEKERLEQAAQKAKDELAEKERLADEAKKAQEAQAEKDRLAEEVKRKELAALAQKRKDEEAAKKAEETEPEKESVAEESNINPIDVDSTNEKKPDEVPQVIFKVQLLASSQVIPLEPTNFNGLDTLSKEPVKNLFRYMYGNAATYEEAKTLKSNADSKGYPTSYIVAYKDGKRIAVKEARKYLNE